MENQHRFIDGYRELSEREINAMNDIKRLGNSLGNFLISLEGNDDVRIDPRWLAIAHTQIQQGIMAAVRAVAQPTNY